MLEKNIIHLNGLISLSDVGANGATKHRAAARALLDARVAALANDEMAARDEHHCARRRHAHDANALRRIGCRWLRCCRASGLRLFWRRVIVRAMTPQLGGASDEVGVRVDLLV